ncbi:MAG: trypsin-like peptidase domain-containing protein [Planctomycetota bacterium]
MKRAALFLLLVFFFPRTCSADDLDKDALQGSILEIVDKVYPACVGITEFEDVDLLGGFSGVIVSSDGYILTAGHAIEPGGKYRVMLHDGREFTGHGLGREPNYDCALMKIVEEDVELPVAEMGWSSDLQVNQPCISISHAGELNIERGPVVRFGRIIDPSSPVNGFVQSTCLMEPGDSGGPLFDMRGRVIGIHSMIQEPIDENFEVPIDAFRRFWPELNEENTFRARTVDRENRFGIRLIRSRDASDPDYDESSIRRGVRVYRVAADSIAEAAGLKRNDWIVGINSTRVSTSYEIENALFGSFAWQQGEIVLNVTRGGREQDITLTVPEFGESSEMIQPDMAQFGDKITPVEELAEMPEQFSGIESELDDYTALISSRRDGETTRALGTVLSLGDSSLIVSKSSLVLDNPMATFPEDENGRRVRLEILARDVDNDLVLCKVPDSRGGIPAEDLLPDDDDLPGELLVSPSPASEGDISVVGSNFFYSIREESSGFLGIAPGYEDGKVVLDDVIADQPARKAGFRRGDVILRINEFEVTDDPTLTAALAHFLPGDTITIFALRKGEEFERDVVLAVRPDMGLHVADDFEGGKSRRRDGFEQVFTHDAPIFPEECGGPVFDLNRQFRGINIARFSRTRCYVIPASVVKSFVESTMQGAR